jgi:hypothetical protein
MDQVKNFIDLVVSGQNLEAKSTLENLISSRAFEALDEKKRELASGLFGGMSEEFEQLDEASSTTKVMSKGGSHIGTVQRFKDGKHGVTYHHDNSGKNYVYRDSHEDAVKVIHQMHKSNINKANKELEAAKKKRSMIPEEFEQSEE